MYEQPLSLDAKPAVTPIATVAIAGGCVVGVVAIASSASTAGAIVMLGGLVAIGAVALVLMVLPGRIGDVLLLVAMASIAIPVDKYFLAVDHVGGWPGIRLSASDLALFATVPLALLGILVRRTHNVVPRAVLVIYGLMLLQYLVSFGNAPRRDLAAFEMLSAIHALLVAVLVGSLFRRELLRPMVAVLALQVIVHTGIAAAQVATGRPIGASWFQGATIVSEAFATGDVALRPSGLFDHPIVYADMLLLTLPIVFAGIFVHGGRVWRGALTLTLVVGGAGLALTLSRGAWISTAIGGVILLAIALAHGMLSRRQLMHVFGAVVIATLIVIPPLAKRTYDRVTASNASNLSVRFEVNWIALSMIKRHPLTGVGLSNFLPVMDQYDPTNVMRRFPATVHNLYLLEGAEAGIPGLVLIVALFGTILTIGWRQLSAMTDLGAMWVAAAIIAGLCAFLISELADFSHRLEPLRSLIWMNIGLLFALQRSARSDAAWRLR